ncbi:unnamed protein product, partial [Iphiclides podalirius]
MGILRGLIESLSSANRHVSIRRSRSDPRPDRITVSLFHYKYAPRSAGDPGVDLPKFSGVNERPSEVE